MKKLLILVLILMAGCSGYKSNKNPLSPEEIRIADLAEKLETNAAELKDDAESPNEEVLSEFADRASRFHNACRRFGSNSLEARSAFDRLHYQASQVSTSLTKEVNPELYGEWEKVRAELLEIAQILGYRPEKSE